MRPAIVVSLACVALACAGPAPIDRRASASASAPAATENAAASASGARGDPAPAPVFRSDAPVALVVRGGRVLAGKSLDAPPRRADVVVDGGKVVFVGEVAPEVRAEHTLDATGLVVAPGFVDAHAHADPLAGGDHLLAMGVTTIVVGQDGFSPAERIGAWLDKVDAAKPRVNVATLVGHHTVRSASGAGAGAKLPSKTLSRMVGLVEKAMDEGAFGLSTGLEYEPGSAAGAAELAGLAEPVGARGGVVMSHLRSEDDDKIDDALTELLDQCRSGKARAHVAHLKVVLGKGAPRAERLLARLREARASGLEVTADIYPYTASYTSIGILFPPFAKPPNDYEEARRANRARLLAHLKERVEKRNGPEATLFGTGEHAGKTLATVAKDKGVPFEEILADLGPSGASAAYFVMDEAVMEKLFTDPFVMVGTDGGGGGLHPRGHGSFPRVIKRLVLEKKLVPLHEAVRKMALLPARTLRIDGERGFVGPGASADLAIFDPAELDDVASFERPHAIAKGMRHVVVNGVVAWKDGKPTGARAGRALRFEGT